MLRVLKVRKWGIAFKPGGLAENSRWQAKAPPPEMSSNAIPPRQAVAENGNRRVDRSLAPHSGCGGRGVARFRWWRELTTGYCLAPRSGCLLQAPRSLIGITRLQQRVGAVEVGTIPFRSVSHSRDRQGRELGLKNRV